MSRFPLLSSYLGLLLPSLLIAIDERFAAMADGSYWEEHDDGDARDLEQLLVEPADLSGGWE